MEEIETANQEENELVPVKYDDEERATVMGRDLHAALGVETPYHKWFPRMAEYGFEEGLDFVTVDKNVLRKDGAEMPQTLVTPKGRETFRLLLDMRI